MKISRSAVLLLFLTCAFHLAEAKDFTAGDPLVRADGTVRMDIISGYNHLDKSLLILNPDNSDEAMAFVVCRNMQAGSGIQKECTAQNFQPEFLNCQVKARAVASKGLSIELKPEYNSTIAKNSTNQVSFIHCSKNSEGEAGCKLTKKAPFGTCQFKSEEAAETDGGKGGNKAVPRKQRSSSGAN